jgi:hypothetical protein
MTLCKTITEKKIYYNKKLPELFYSIKARLDLWMATDYRVREGRGKGEERAMEG